MDVQQHLLLRPTWRARLPFEAVRCSGEPCGAGAAVGPTACGCALAAAARVDGVAGVIRH